MHDAFDTLSSVDLAPLRAQFPALRQKPAAIFLDNPGGTQVPISVIDAVTSYYASSNANVGGVFATSQRTDSVVADARQAMADLLGTPNDPGTIVLGASMTALTFHLARSFGETLQPGDEIVVTNLDHDANVSPWTDLAAQGAVIRAIDIHTEDGTLDLQSYQAALRPGRTRLVAITHASNAVGTVPDVALLTQLAHEAGALVFVVRQFAPTRLRATGAVIGLAAGAASATLYSLHCPEAGASFVLTWYSLGIAAATAIGAALGPRLLRW